ncbi:hypothetical protein H2203_004570 [Taxawa tesnikishii (nom. ined.)]|nr:hypothetical protein H2203_004570 [Dothideales sp. JES 119]
MKTAAVLSSLALALPAFAAPAPQVAEGSRESGSCPSNNNALLTSNNWLNYRISCGRDLRTKVIRVTETEIGIQGCLTACDGTVGCSAVTYTATDDAQTKGYCYSRSVGNGKTHKAGRHTALAVYESNSIADATPTSSSASATSSAATSATASSTSTPGAFGGVAIRSGSAIQYSSVNANGTYFWLNRGTASYCPSTVPDCVTVNQTSFVGGNDTLFLDVSVPGGQQVYVDSKGRLAFTVPHSGNTGVGSSVTGFSIVDDGLHLRFNGNDFYACPLGEAYGNAYQVYAAGSNATSNFGDACEGFEFRIAEAGPGYQNAYQYS